MESSIESTKVPLKGFGIAYYPDHTVAKSTKDKDISIEECNPLMRQIIKVIVSKHIDYEVESGSFNRSNIKDNLKDFENHNVYYRF